MAAFRVDVEPDVSAVARDKKTPKDVRAGFTSAYTRLEAEGCAVASYRLSGAGEHPRYCVGEHPPQLAAHHRIPRPGRSPAPHPRRAREVE